MKDNLFYGWFDDAEQEKPSYDPPHYGPCLFCGRAIRPEDIKTHSILRDGYAERCYFYRTHKSCADRDRTHIAMDDIVFSMIERNGD